MSQLSCERGIRITMYCAEVEADKVHYRENHDMPAGEFCQHVGRLGNQTVLIHMIWLDDPDFKLLAETGTHVSHTHLQIVNGIRCSTHSTLFTGRCECGSWL